MRSLYALHLSLSVTIPAIQPRLRLSGTNRLRSAFHGGQRLSNLAVRSIKDALRQGSVVNRYGCCGRLDLFAPMVPLSNVYHRAD
ncbi:MAG: hypothetical protein KZQ66_04140 [Candidatus Thiodiazotropha sp. (ex Lucinoma aequizonata)]|nr:hypothetical protein [Candidatus Thiodiazotropha sp. (ex Lucinoma aequizonata)]MCU7887778.1 hypothetical protein [Candidatus Thiodiazotropha sp. (ex Lucinoma aequizonata)]MCU7893737.1 hypothetical protein [Candidatus Thiodiazotropha sp. (ex Lucinoma aequizonata)]MCU7900334.1 hypothetical protein [Candidatus Thiodiazotropha sp. (ex Lucinoma aequizonata)]MCU7901288.1 hypothetical protein [Candidatus Thiodiazotropha sp. (ex Lucinoma aequizonata)]